MAGIPKVTAQSKQMSMMAGLKQAIEFSDSSFVFTTVHSGGCKKLLIKDCESSTEITIPPDHMFMLKKVLDAEVKAITQLPHIEPEYEPIEPATTPSLDDELEPEPETAEELIARLEKEKEKSKAAATKK
jgi:hypothetical protein